MAKPEVREWAPEEGKPAEREKPPKPKHTEKELRGEEGPDPVPGRFFLYGHSLGTPHLYLGRRDRWKTHPHLQTRDQNH
jgi:hypothetical protein